jgi:anhydro-N-acetylmuramic acid kinase
MATILRFDPPQAAEARRWAVGVLVAADGRRLSAAAVAVVGRGLEVRPQIVGSLNLPIPAETIALFDQLSGRAGGTPPAVMAEAVAALRMQLAEVEASAVTELLNRVRLAPARVLAVGVHDPGLWSSDRTKGRSYLGLCDAACLAELTGLNVVDAFPARDVVRGGLGGPLLTMPQWLLLRSAKRDRLLLDLGRTARLAVLPAAAGSHAASRMVAFDVGPGMQLLDLLAQRLSSGRHPFDPGGRLGVQGRRIAPVIEHWLADPYFQLPLPRWDPRGVDAERFFREGMDMAAEAGWSVRDLLCSATHFVAHSIARTIRAYVPSVVSPGELLLAGGGQQNGMLLREIATELPNLPMVRLSDVGMPSDSLDPAAVAILAMFHLDQVPANPTSVTGSDLCRVLGRLTPGSPQSWQRLLTDLTGTTPMVRPLRAAL